MRILFIGILIGLALTAQAQNSLKVVVQDSLTKESLIGVTAQFKGTTNGAASDVNGAVSLSKIPNGRQTLLFSFVGYHTKTLSFVFPLANPEQVVTILLASETENLDEVTVSATRTNSRIEDLPMKVEVLGIEDMEEESSIKPASIASILGDLSVIHIQQTSAVNGSSAVRMQGLDGKYTQMLRDGLPLYEGFSGSFGVLQIPPLDLKQVEIIKGSTSTLYGGGAIAGMINLVSKAPAATRDFSVTLNRSTLKESNLNTYFSQQFGKFGITFFGGYTQQKAIDVNSDGFSDLPEINHLTLHPKFFYNFSDKTKLNIGLSYLTENRTGGDMLAIGKSTIDPLHPYFQRNENQRITTDFNLSHNFDKDHKLTAKGTVSNFDRKLTQANLGFGGRQISNYLELSDYLKVKTTEWVFGANFTTEQFTKNLPDTTKITNFKYQTFGLFGQLGWHVTPQWLIETGLRVDFHNAYGTFVLPRIAFLYKPSKDFSLRLSSGAGYKTPNIFTAGTTAGNIRNLLPIAISVKPERSVGVNMDINYNFNIGEHITATLNQAFYYSNIQSPIVASQNAAGFVSLNNSKANVNSLGTDTYIRFVIDDVELYLGYNHTISKRVGDGADVFLAFGPQDKFSSTLTYEIEGKWRFGIENSWIGNQYATLDSYDLTQLRKVPNYWFWAGMVERKFGSKISIVLNGENWFDFRQSKTEKLFTGTTQNPDFVNLWGPIDGRVINLALRVKI
jgi:outer membrane receptor for ferrienterochelin and colicin